MRNHSAPLTSMIASCCLIAVPILVCFVMFCSGPPLDPFKHWIFLAVMFGVYVACGAGVWCGFNWVRKLYASVFGLMVGICLVSWLVPFGMHVRSVGRTHYPWYVGWATYCIIAAHFAALVFCFLPRSNSYFAPWKGEPSHGHA